MPSVSVARSATRAAGEGLRAADPAALEADAGRCPGPCAPRPRARSRAARSSRASSAGSAGSGWPAPPGRAPRAAARGCRPRARRRRRPAPRPSSAKLRRSSTSAFSVRWKRSSLPWVCGMVGPAMADARRPGPAARRSDACAAPGPPCPRAGRCRSGCAGAGRSGGTAARQPRLHRLAPARRRRRRAPAQSASGRRARSADGSGPRPARSGP